MFLEGWCEFMEHPVYVCLNTSMLQRIKKVLDEVVAILVIYYYVMFLSETNFLMTKLTLIM